MWGFFQPVAELVDIDGQAAVLRSDRRLPAGRLIELKLLTARGKMAVKAHICTTRSLAGPGYASTALLPPTLRLTEADCRQAEVGVRRSPRLECRLRVLSPDLPGYRGVTVDFSLGGLQLEASNELKVGQVILLRVEPDHADLQPLECQGRVAWSTRRGRTTVAHGVEFIELSPEARAHVQAFDKHLRDVAEMPIALRVLG